MTRLTGAVLVGLFVLAACGADDDSDDATRSNDMTIDEATTELRALMDDAAAAGASGATVTYLDDGVPGECGPTPRSAGGPVAQSLTLDITLDAVGAGGDVIERIVQHWRDGDFDVKDHGQVDDIVDFSGTRNDFQLRAVSNLADPTVRILGQSPCVIDP